MKMLTYAAIIALGTASAAFAQTSQSAPANTPSTPDQSVTAPTQNGPTQHSGAESSPSGMGGPNAAAPMRDSNAGMSNGNDHNATASGADMHRVHHRMSGQAAHGRMARNANPRNDTQENEVTAQLNQQQIANDGRIPQTANSPSDCSGNQSGCMPGRGNGSTP
jgi:hypothetical protein